MTELDPQFQPIPYDGPMPAAATVANFIQTLDKLGGNELEPSEASPLFILATSWRCGSTLLQRTLMTDRSLLLWGEPHGASAVVSRMTRALCGPMNGFPQSYLIDRFKKHEDDLVKSWIANLYPPIKSYKKSLRSQMEEWLAASAAEQGFSQWGAKFVRLGLAEAFYLHWLFPKAKFLVLVRHPLACYRSIKAGLPKGFNYYMYPNSMISNVQDFANHWTRLTKDWLQLKPEMKFLILRYEDLLNKDFNYRELETWCDLKLSETDALGYNIGMSKDKPKLTDEDFNVINDTCGDLLKAMKYPTAKESFPSEWF